MRFILSAKLIELISRAPVGLADNFVVPIVIVLAPTNILFHFLSDEPNEKVLSNVGIILAPIYNILLTLRGISGIVIVSFSINLLTVPCSIISAVNVLEPVPPLAIDNVPDDILLAFKAFIKEPFPVILVAASVFVVLFQVKLADCMGVLAAFPTTS